MKLDNTKVYYLASPFSSESKYLEQYRAKQINEIACKLIKEQQLIMILPITTSYALNQTEELGHTFDYWRKFDLALLGRCDAIIVVEMPGWENSKGVLAEIEFSMQNSKDIYFMHPYTLEVDTKLWRDLPSALRK